jgi:hypothetical protein
MAIDFWLAQSSGYERRYYLRLASPCLSMATEARFESTIDVLVFQLNLLSMLRKIRRTLGTEQGRNKHI